MIKLFMNKKVLISSVLFLSLMPLFSVLALTPANNCAQYCADTETWDPPVGETCFCNPLKHETFNELIDAIIDFLFYVALAIVPLSVLIGAFHILTAGGDPKRVKTGQNFVLYAVIGLGVILFARGFSAVIKNILGG